MRLTPIDATDSVQQLAGSESSYKCQIEIKLGDKPLLLSTGSSEQSQELCNALYHVIFFALNGFHPALPPPPSLAWNLPLLFGYLNGGFVKGLFEREAVYQGIPEEIRPWVWKKLSEYLLSGTLILDSSDMATLTSSMASLPQHWERSIAQQGLKEEESEVLRLLCKFVCITMISLCWHSLSPSRHAEQDAVESICALGGYLLSNLPQDVAISLFQCLMQRILPIWLKPNVFQTVAADWAREA